MIYFESGEQWVAHVEGVHVCVMREKWVQWDVITDSCNIVLYIYNCMSKSLI